MKRILALLVLALLSVSSAQELRVGIILPFDTAGNESFRTVVAGVRRSISGHFSPVMRNIVLLERADGGSAARAAELARELVRDDDVHVLVCCSDPRSLDAVAAVADELQVLTLALSGSEALAAGGMVRSLAPDLLSALRASTLAARRHNGDLSLMTTDDERGDAIEDAFRAGALEAGMPVMRTVRFRSGSAPLTPEALLAATSQAEAIIVWADTSDSREAVRSLRARGWTGPVILDYWQSAELAADSSLGPLEFAVPPVALTGSLPAGTPNQAALSSYRVASGPILSGSEASLPGALLFDALNLAIFSFEQALVYGAQLNLSSAQVRSAVHDGLVGTGSVPLAAGTYRYLATTASLAQPAGQIPAVGRNGRFTALDR